MSENKRRDDVPHNYREDNQPHNQTGNINSRNNNLSDDNPEDNPNVERANDTGLGDAGVNDEKLTRYTQNHSGEV